MVDLSFIEAIYIYSETCYLLNSTILRKRCGVAEVCENHSTRFACPAPSWLKTEKLYVEWNDDSSFV